MFSIPIPIQTKHKGKPSLADVTPLPMGNRKPPGKEIPGYHLDITGIQIPATQKTFKKLRKKMKISIMQLQYGKSVP